MKKLLAFALVLCLAAGLCACGTSDEKIKAVREVSFEGTELTVTLGTNKSTGCEWDFEIFGECIEPSINRVFKILGSGGDATGTLSIGFEGIGEGEAVIVFTTPCGWDGSGSGDAYTVRVAVGADGAIKSAEGEEGAQAPAVKTALAVFELANGEYKGTMSGTSWSGTYDEGYSISTEVSPAEITVTIENGAIYLHCEADAVSSGAVLDVPAPDSPTHKKTFAGELPLEQTDENTVSAEGKLPDCGERSWIYWDGNMKFTHWEIESAAEDSSSPTYDCKVTITMVNGVPTAAIEVNGSASHRTATVPLKLKAEGASAA